MSFKVFVLGILLAWTIGVGLITNAAVDSLGTPSSTQEYSPGELIEAAESDKLTWEADEVTVTVFDQGGVINFTDNTPLLVPSVGAPITKPGTYTLTARSLVIDDTEGQSGGLIKLKVEGATVTRHYTPSDSRGGVILLAIVIEVIGVAVLIGTANEWLMPFYTAANKYDTMLSDARQRRREANIKRKNDYFHEN